MNIQFNCQVFIPQHNGAEISFSACTAQQAKAKAVHEANRRGISVFIRNLTTGYVEAVTPTKK